MLTSSNIFFAQSNKHNFENTNKHQKSGKFLLFLCIFAGVAPQRRLRDIHCAGAVLIFSVENENILNNSHLSDQIRIGNIIEKYWELTRIFGAMKNKTVNQMSQSDFHTGHVFRVNIYLLAYESSSVLSLHSLFVNMKHVLPILRKQPIVVIFRPIIIYISIIPQIAVQTRIYCMKTRVSKNALCSVPTSTA